MAATVSPPGLLSILDGAMGGGWGASRPGSDIAFGTTWQTLDVWAPSDKATAPRPVLIFWYGGGWVKGDRRAYAFAARAFAKAGFVVVMPDTSKRAVDALGNAADPKMTQPITFARCDAPPMLLVTSTADTEVKPHNAYDLAARLKSLGAPVTLIDYPGLSHEDVAMALSKPFRGKGPVLADSVAFLMKAMPARR